MSPRCLPSYLGNLVAREKICSESITFNAMDVTEGAVKKGTIKECFKLQATQKKSENKKL